MLDTYPSFEQDYEVSLKKVLFRWNINFKNHTHHSHWWIHLGIIIYFGNLPFFWSLTLKKNMSGRLHVILSFSTNSSRTASTPLTMIFVLCPSDNENTSPYNFRRNWIPTLGSRGGSFTRNMPRYMDVTDGPGGSRLFMAYSFKKYTVPQITRKAHRIPTIITVELVCKWKKGELFTNVKENSAVF